MIQDYLNLYNVSKKDITIGNKKCHKIKNMYTYKTKLYKNNHIFMLQKSLKIAIESSQNILNLLSDYDSIASF